MNKVLSPIRDFLHQILVGIPVKGEKVDYSKTSFSTTMPTDVTFTEWHDKEWNNFHWKK